MDTVDSGLGDDTVRISHLDGLRTSALSVAKVCILHLFAVVGCPVSWTMTL